MMKSNIYKSTALLLGALLMALWLPAACATGEKTQEPGTEKSADATTPGTPDAVAKVDAVPDTSKTTPDTPKPADRDAPDEGKTTPDTPKPADTPAPDEGSPDAPPTERATPEKMGTQEITGGDVDGQWCGDYRITGSITVAAGKTLTLCAGSVLAFERNAALTVIGTLEINGTAGKEVEIKSTGTFWQGIQVTGTLKGDHFILRQGKICILGRSGSTVNVTNGQLLKCQQGFDLANGGTFTKSQIKGGNSCALSDGILKMTDSIIDLEVPKSGPDCTKLDGGGLTLDHVRFTGCHCPLHINKLTKPSNITNSIFDGATYPMMIAGATVTFRNNHFVKGSAHILDIGGNINADVADNYWEGGAPSIQTSNAGQFTGTKQFSTKPIPGVGPR